MTPEGWRILPLGDAATLQRGFDLPVQHRQPGPVPVVASNGPVGLHCTAAVQGPGVVTGRSGTIGKVFYYSNSFWPLNTTLYVSDFHGNDPRFVARLLDGLSLQKYAASTGVPSLNRNFVHPLPVLLPPVAEQRSIAAILTSVDEAIEATQAVIEQLQVLKRAMTADLLNRGLPGKHTRFKQTEIGEMPEEWRVVRVDEIGPADRPTAQTGPFGAQLRPEDFSDFGVPVLKIGNVRWGRLELDDLDYVSPEKAKELARFMVVPGDLLFARQGATTGRNALATGACAGWLINYHIIRVATDRAQCTPEYLMTCFNSDLVQKQVGRDKGRGNRDGINTANILGFRLPLPSLEEQSAMTRVLGDLEEATLANEEQRRQLMSLKSALMSVLLSGEVRVKTDLEPG